MGIKIMGSKFFPNSNNFKRYSYQMIIYQDRRNVCLRKIQYKGSRTMRFVNFPEGRISPTTIESALGLIPSHFQLMRHGRERGTIEGI